MSASFRFFAVVAVALIAMMTLTPLGPGLHSRLVEAIGGDDYAWHVAVVLNILLFVPVGIVIGWSRRPMLLLAAPVASICIELTQLLLDSRNADPFDVVANTAGAVVGFLLFRLWARSAPTGPDDRSSQERPTTGSRQER